MDIRKDEADIGFEEKVSLAIAGLAGIEGIGPALAEKLVHAGFLTVEGILAADVDDLQAIEGFDEEQAKAVRAAAEKAFESQEGAGQA